MYRKNAWENLAEDEKEQLSAFAKDYMAFLNNGKTERECVAEGVRQAEAKGFKNLMDVVKNGETLKAGDRVYRAWMNKDIMLFIIGEKPMECGMNILGAHIDSPRIDIKQNPLYEDEHLAYLDTHYYGGIKKYQWVALPLALHGVVVKKDGTTVTLNIGDKPGDPVFYISDLLIHLAADQMGKTAAKVIEGDSLNIIIGSEPKKDTDKDPVKTAILDILKEQYGIDEEDFISAELEAVPAGHARDLGFDRSMIMGYGHDDRVCAYPSMAAVLNYEGTPEYTLAAVLTDKEEIGSDGVTGMQSMYVFHFLQLLCRAAGQDDIIAFQNSVCLSADVTAAYDPSWAGAFEPKNGTYAGRGVAFFKYTGSRGKSSASDANAELVGDITRLLDANNVAWQIGELGRLDLGGGGTIAKYVANRGIPVLDIGVPVLSMHSPFEVIHKTDLYMAYRTFSLFCQNAE